MARPPFRSQRLHNALHKMYIEANKASLKTNPALAAFTELRDATLREGPRVAKDSTKNYRRKKLKALRMKCDRYLKTSEELKNALEKRFRTFGTTVVVTKQSDNKTFNKVKPTCRNFYYAQGGFYDGEDAAAAAAEEEPSGEDDDSSSDSSSDDSDSD